MAIYTDYTDCESRYTFEKPPCTGCKHQETCTANLYACEVFANYVDEPVTTRRKLKRTPHAWIYYVIFHRTFRPSNEEAQALFPPEMDTCKPPTTKPCASSYKF